MLTAYGMYPCQLHLGSPYYGKNRCTPSLLLLGCCSLIMIRSSSTPYSSSGEITADFNLATLQWRVWASLVMYWVIPDHNSGNNSEVSWLCCMGTVLLTIFMLVRNSWLKPLLSVVGKWYMLTWILSWTWAVIAKLLKFCLASLILIIFSPFPFSFIWNDIEMSWLCNN